MDPNETISLLVQAILDADQDYVAEYSGILFEWMSKGGAAPEIGREDMMTILRHIHEAASD